MRERSVVWDVLMVALLLALVLINGVTLLQNRRLETQNLAIMLRVKQLQSGGMTVRTEASGGSASAGEKHSPSYFDGSTNPKWPRGDENAQDGDTLVINEGAEPNSLNPLIDNDATADDIWHRANDYLAERAFDDLNYWEPKLARAWDKAMVCRGIATKKNARELADKLNAAWPPDERAKLKIDKIEAESDDILRIELFDTATDYRDAAIKALGEDAVARQHWFYVSFEGEKFADGAAVDAKTVAARVRKVISAAPDFKGRFLPNWERESSVVVELLGNADAAEKALREYIASDQTMGQAADPNSSTGKTVKHLLTFDSAEHYNFEEKPVYTYYLRRGVRWHDGEDFTGKDVVFSFRTMMNPGVECAPNRNYYQDCESVNLVNGDPYTVQFVWKKPYVQSFSASCEMYLFPEHVYRFTVAKEFNESSKNQSLIGTGPYKFEKWDRKQQLVYVRNEDYWGKKPHLNKVICKFVVDRTVSMQMLLAEELDVHNMTKKQARDAEADEKFKSKFGIEVSVANVFSYVGWNMRRNLFKSEKTRRALTMLLDRKKIVDSIMLGYALPLDVPTHPVSPAWPPNAEKFHVPYDVEAAKKLLAEDGWKDTDGDNVLDKDFGDGKRTPFKFTVIFQPGSPEFEQVAIMMKDAFAQVGIVVSIQNYEWKVFLQNIERLNFDAMLGSWQVGIDDDPYQLFHSSQIVEKASNHCGYVDKEVDKLIETARTELDDSKRNPMLQEIYGRIAQAQPYTCLYVWKRTVAYDKRLQNVVYKLRGAQLARWWVPVDKQKDK